MVVGGVEGEGAACQWAWSVCFGDESGLNAHIGRRFQRRKGFHDERDDRLKKLNPLVRVGDQLLFIREPSFGLRSVLPSALSNLGSFVVSRSG